MCMCRSPFPVSDSELELWVDRACGTGDYKGLKFGVTKLFARVMMTGHDTIWLFY